MQYKVIKKAFYNGSLVNPGDLIVTEHKLPEPCSWAEVVKSEPKKSLKKAKKRAEKTPEAGATEIAEDYDFMNEVLAEDEVESL